MTITLHVNLRAVFAGFVLLVAAAAIATPVAISLADNEPSSNGSFAALGTAFAYQGRLEVDGLPAEGNFDFRFTLHSDAEANAPVGFPLMQPLAVSNGQFVASLDFGAGAFDGNARWLAVEARQGANQFVALSPRQALTPTPYALFAQAAPWGGITSRPDGLDDGDNDALTSLVCTNGQVAKMKPNGWACDEDIVGTSGNTYTAGAGISQDQTQFSLDTAFTDDRYWKQGGNDSVTSYLGTNDLAPLEFRVNAQRVLRIEPGFSPNIIAGSSANWARAGIAGATISGGGIQWWSVPPIFLCAGANRVRDTFGTVGGGCANTAGLGDDSGANATVGGGFFNTASGESSTVSGGVGNDATASKATVGGGWDNLASGEGATIPGGSNNSAVGSGSFAAGTTAKSNNPGCFTWADSSTTALDCNTDNKFLARARGGVQFATSLDLSTGCSMAAGGIAWSCTSDRNMKTNFSSTDGRDVLAKVAGLQVQTWNAKTEDPGIRHMGVMAQDFHAAFGLGDSDLTIATVDADGVAFAAIQGLNSLAEEQEARIAALEAKLAGIDGVVAQPQPAAGSIETEVSGRANRAAPSWLLASAMTVLATSLFAVAGALVKRGRA